jgi:transcriptional regulator with XRE-family HTH domain
MTTGPGERGDKLARLIQSRVDAGDSLRDISQRAVAAGYDVSHTYVDNLRKRIVPKAPDRRQLAALAAGLGVSEDRMRRIIVQDFYGWDPGDGAEDPEDLADLIDLLRSVFAKVPNGEPRRDLRKAVTRALVEWQI